jgi:hypothetical protein
VNQFDEITARIEADWPAWHAWYVPAAVGRPVVTFHAHRWGDERHVIHGSSPVELAAAIEREQEEGLAVTGTDEVTEDLRRAHPGWRVWVHHREDAEPVYCARLNGTMIMSLSAWGLSTGITLTGDR